MSVAADEAERLALLLIGELHGMEVELMEGAIAPLRQDWLPAKRREGAAMTTCRIAGYTLGALALVIVLSQVPDIIRYYRMAQM